MKTNVAQGFTAVLFSAHGLIANYVFAQGFIANMYASQGFMAVKESSQIVVITISVHGSIGIISHAKGFISPILRRNLHSKIIPRRSSYQVLFANMDS